MDKWEYAHILNKKIGECESEEAYYMQYLLWKHWHKNKDTTFEIIMSEIIKDTESFDIFSKIIARILFKRDLALGYISPGRSRTFEEILKEIKT